MNRLYIMFITKHMDRIFSHYLWRCERWQVKKKFFSIFFLNFNELTNCSLFFFRNLFHTDGKLKVDFFNLFFLNKTFANIFYLFFLLVIWVLIGVNNLKTVGSLRNFSFVFFLVEIK
jgi:hypothetical protein